MVSLTSETLPLVIVNPASRGGAGARDWPKAAAALAAHLGAFEPRFTEGPGHASHIAREEAEAGRRLLIAFGGDGTISEAARGIIASGSDSVLGILPHGTGGDFVRSLAIPRDYRDAARELRRGRTIRVDVGRVVFASGVERRFVNAASFGLSADVALRVNQGTKSRASYARETVRAALSFEPPAVELAVDGKPARRVQITSVSLHNGRFFGGGMKMAPLAELADGKLQAVIVKKMPVLRLLSRAPLLYAGAHLSLPELENAPVSVLDARPADTARAIPVEADGESAGELPARFEVEPNALSVRIPADAAPGGSPCPDAFRAPRRSW